MVRLRNRSKREVQLWNSKAANLQWKLSILVCTESWSNKGTSLRIDLLASTCACLDSGLWCALEAQVSFVESLPVSGLSLHRLGQCWWGQTRALSPTGGTVCRRGVSRSHGHGKATLPWTPSIPMVRMLTFDLWACMAFFHTLCTKPTHSPLPLFLLGTKLSPS